MSDLSLFQSPASSQSTGAARYVRVVVERGIEKVGRRKSSTRAAHTPATNPEAALTYRDDVGGLLVGERVLVPLGRGNTRSGGLVVAVGGEELLEGISPDRAKGVIARTGGSLIPGLVDLARWIAHYYVCPLGMVVSAMTPAAVKRDIGSRLVKKLVRNDLPTESAANLLTEAAPAVRAAWQACSALDPSLFPLSAHDLVLELGLKNKRAINDLLRRGLLVEHARAEVVRGEARHATQSTLSDSGPRVTLNEDQRAAMSAIAADFARFAVHLLHGVTGSGKTEVYLRLIEHVIAAGKSAIVLVPEIALTPQTAGRFVSRFSGPGSGDSPPATEDRRPGSSRVAVLHSGLTAAQRNHEWTRVSRGEVSVVVGARSAVFSPLENLGIIVVDEEHDSGYKQDQLPRYHARDVAIKRAQFAACPVVLGSATPSLESWSNATTPTGPGAAPRYHLWRLSRRATDAPLPRVEIVDLMEERRIAREQGDRSQWLLGPRLRAAIHHTLTNKGQCLLLLNRRGFGQYISCTGPHCDFVLHCDQCTAALVYHKESELRVGGVVKCHHCLSEQLLPKLCPTCGSRLHIFGGGTQKAEEEIERCFASHAIVRGETLLRVDSDTMRSARDYFNAISRFAKGEIRILLGTQMIAKGLDVPNVRLVGVIDADTAASIPDFRAAERTFQLLTQVAGRAGRAHAPGHVLVQTVDPASRPIVLAAQHDYVTFATDELAARRRFNLPPALRMARIVCRDREPAKARDAALRLVNALTRAGGETLAVQGPSECPMFRIARQYRYEVTASALAAGTLQRALAQVRAEGLLKSDAKTAVDVDPVSMM